MRAVLCRVGQPPEEIETENTLEALQTLVGGYIESVPYNAPERGILCICDEEGKLKHKHPNRLIIKHGKILDYIAGDFILVGIDPFAGDFVSLTDEQMDYINRTIHAGRILYETRESR